MRTKAFSGLLLVLMMTVPAFAGEWTKTFTVAGPPEVQVKTNDAAVRILAGDFKDIEARVTTEGWTIGRDGVRVTDRQSGNRVQLDVRTPSDFRYSGHRSATVELRVPRETSVEVRSGDGSISAEGLKGRTRLSTEDGSIKAYALDGSLDAKSNDGRITVRGRLDLLSIHTLDGSIEAEIGPGSKMAAGWRIQTADGSVRLRLPADFAADLDVHTGDGHISLDFPVTVSGSRVEHTLLGTMNGGGQTLTIRTGDGSVRLERMVASLSRW